MNAMQTSTRLDIAELELAELEQVLGELGWPPFHARQIFRWMHKRAATDFARMTDLSHDLRAALAERLTIGAPVVARRERSDDGTTKFLLRLADGRQIESVFIPDTPSMTFCVSTQVGCAMKCAFCLTGKMGIDRNLTAGEISGQVRVLARELDMLDTRFNIVLMGMGEPLHNYEQTMKALRMLADEYGMGLSARRVTLSTVGVLPALERLATEPLMPNLAISLHSTTEDQRDRLVPVNRKIRAAGAARRVPPVPPETTRAHHVRVRPAEGRERHSRRCPAARAAPARHQGQGQPAAAQRSARHPVRTPLGRSREPVREDPRRSRHHGLRS